MANDFEKDFQRLIANLKKVANALNERSVTLRLARKCREIVYRRLKSGYGVNDDSERAENVKRQKLKELSQSYIDYRKGLVIFYRDADGRVRRISGSKAVLQIIDGGTRRSRVRTGKITAPALGEFGRPEKSNATLSGQMLDAMTIDAGRDGFRLFIADSPRRRVHPKQRPPKLTNQEVAEHYFEKRPGMALTEGEVRILKQECERILNEKIKQLIR
jgi:hypothetical protein